MTNRPFQVMCEIEPPTRPDLMHVRHQIGTLSKVADAFLIPDNHLGRATVSSVAVAHEVEAMGGRSIACLNSRDRNLLGFRRDLLTAASYHVDQFLFVQVSFSLDDLLRWREANPVDVPVYVGVIVLASESHAQRLAAAVPDIAIPPGLTHRVRTDRLAGVEAACDLVLQIRDSGAFAGVHLIPVARYREVAARLEQRLA